MKLCLFSLGLLLVSSGCAAERAAWQISENAGEIATVAVHNAAETLEKVELEGTGRLQDPHYRVLAVWVTGLLLDVGLDGAFLEGRIEGKGVGRLSDPESVAALQKALREKLGDRYPGDEFVLSVVDLIRGKPDVASVVGPGK